MFNIAIGELEAISQTALDKAKEEIESPILKETWLDTYQSTRDAARFLELAQFGGVTALVNSVRQWGLDRNIIGPNSKATIDSQFNKLLEEVDEIRVGIEKKDQGEIIDGIGDCAVVLILLAELVGVKFENCLLTAYEEIKNRKGKMVDGAFIKES